MRKPIMILLTLALLLGIVPTVSADTCTFVLGFETLRSMIPTVAGGCLENEWHNGCTGDGIQRTTGGMMVWRKADNWTAFTDGYRTWINGPCGLQQRLNSHRFPWEPEIGGLLECSGAAVPLPAGYVQPPMCPEGGSPAPSTGVPTIHYFNTNDSNISSGQSVTLSWDLTGATSVEIQPGVGGVTAPGTVVVSPAATTVYTLIAHGTAGDATAQVTITVSTLLPPLFPFPLPLFVLKTFTSIDAEDGRVGPTGVDSLVLAGDSVGNIPSRALMSFDISSLAGKTVTSAKLDLTVHTKQSNGPGSNPFGASQLGNMEVLDIQYGVPSAPDYSTAGVNVWTIGAPPIGQRDVTDRVKARVAEGRTRYQLRLQFTKTTDLDGLADYLRWNSGDAKLIVSYH